MRHKVIVFAAVAMAPALLAACQTKHLEVGSGVFACDSGRTLVIREEGAKRIASLDSGPDIVLSPMPRRERLWWEGGDYSLRISRDRADWLAREGAMFRRDWCRRKAEAV